MKHAKHQLPHRLGVRNRRSNAAGGLRQTQVSKEMLTGRQLRYDYYDWQTNR